MLFVQIWNHGLGVNGEALAHALRDACLTLDWPELKEKNGLCVRAVLDGPEDAGPVYIVAKHVSRPRNSGPFCQLLMETVEKFFTDTIHRQRDVIILPEKITGIWA